MQVLAVLFGSLVLYRAVGAAGVSLFSSWVVSARFALVTMFLFTAVSHFAPMRKDLICDGAAQPAQTGFTRLRDGCPGVGRGGRPALRYHTILGGVRAYSADGGNASGQRERRAPRN